MTIINILAVYFIVWWVVLFAVLPWGVRSQIEDGDMVAGTDPGAPSKPRLLRIVVVTTLVSAVIFGVLYGLWSSGYIGIRPPVA